MARQPVKTPNGTIVGWYNANKKRHYKSETPYVRPEAGSPEARAWSARMHALKKSPNATTPCKPTRAGTPQKRVQNDEGKWVCRVGAPRVVATQNTPCPKNNQHRVPKEVQTKTKGKVTRWECRVKNPMSEEERLQKLIDAGPKGRKVAENRRRAKLEQGVNPSAQRPCPLKKGLIQVRVPTGKTTYHRIGTTAYPVPEYKCIIAEDQAAAAANAAAASKNTRSSRSSSSRSSSSSSNSSSSSSSSRGRSSSRSRSVSRAQSVNLGQIAGPSSTPCPPEKPFYRKGKKTNCWTTKQAQSYGWI